MSSSTVYQDESYSGESAHPIWLKRAGLLSCFLAIVTVALGVADTMLAAIKGEPTMSTEYAPINYAFVGVGIWVPISAFITGIFAVYASESVDGSKMIVSISSFISSCIFLPILIAISALEIRQLQAIAQIDPLKLPQRYSIVVTILVMGVFLFIIETFIMIIVCFCTFALEEEESKLVDGKTSNGKAAPCTKCAPVTHQHNFSRATTANNPPTAGPTSPTTYKVMQLVPSNFTAAPTPPHYTVTNMPISYQNPALKVYGS